MHTNAQYSFCNYSDSLGRRLLMSDLTKLNEEKSSVIVCTYNVLPCEIALTGNKFAVDYE